MLLFTVVVVDPAGGDTEEFKGPEEAGAEDEPGETEAGGGGLPEFFSSRPLHFSSGTTKPSGSTQTLWKRTLSIEGFLLSSHPVPVVQTSRVKIAMVRQTKRERRRRGVE